MAAGVRQSLAAVEALFVAAGGDRIAVAEGWLVRVEGDPVRYVIELEG